MKRILSLLCAVLLCAPAGMQASQDNAKTAGIVGSLALGAYAGYKAWNYNYKAKVADTFKELACNKVIINKEAGLCKEDGSSSMQACRHQMGYLAQESNYLKRLYYVTARDAQIKDKYKLKDSLDHSETFFPSSFRQGMLDTQEYYPNGVDEIPLTFQSSLANDARNQNKSLTEQLVLKTGMKPEVANYSCVETEAAAKSYRNYSYGFGFVSAAAVTCAVWFGAKK